MNTYKDIEKKELLPIEVLAKIAINHAQSNNTKEEVKTLICLYNKVQDASSQLLTVSNYDIVGSAYCLMGSYPLFMNNEDTRRVIADNAFYCLSKAIEKDPNKSIYLKRLSVLAYFHKDFYYTIANAMEITDDDIFSVPYTPLIIKTNQYYYDIAFHDFLQIGLKNYPDEQIENLYQLVKQIENCNAQKGIICVNKIINYLSSVYQQY